jgi:hypothetical protein
MSSSVKKVLVTLLNMIYPSYQISKNPVEVNELYSNLRDDLSSIRNQISKKTKQNKRKIHLILKSLKLKRN